MRSGSMHKAGDVILATIQFGDTFEVKKSQLWLCLRIWVML